METCCIWSPTWATPAKLSSIGSSTPCPSMVVARPGEPYWKVGQSLFPTFWPISNTRRPAIRNCQDTEVFSACRSCATVREAEQQRTRELTESLEQQTATSEVL